MSDEDKKGGMNFSLIVAIVVSVMLATGSSYFMMTKFGGLSTNNNSQQAKAESDMEELGPTSEIGQFMVNLAGGRRFIKVNMVFEVSNQKVIEEISQRTPQIRDTIISILRTKEYDTINSSGGSRRLRTEIMNTINKKLLKGKVTNVFFTEFVVQ